MDSFQRPNVNLPAFLTPLIGRQEEVNALINLLQQADVRLVTLTGPGGVGKTRTGIAIAMELACDFPDGVWFVDLAPIGDPDLVAPTIAQAFGLGDVADGSITAGLAGWLRERRVLLLLDNFEQVVDAAPIVADLLSASPGLTVLATSREPLKIGSEHEVPIGPLTLPDLTDGSSRETIGLSDAVRLFIERARAVLPGFAPSNEDWPNLAEVCLRLDGLPLAIELAAARIKVLPVAAMRARLDRRLPVLSGTRRDSPERQKTMRNAIAWSHDLLTPQEQALFRRLAVFQGGLTLEAAETVAVVPSDPGIDVFEGIASLVDKSMLGCDPLLAHDSPEPRYRMLETIREYGFERLVASGEVEAVRTAHAGCFVELATSAGQSFDTGQDVVRWLARLDAELGNVRAALEWLLQSGDATGMLQLLGSTDDYWCARPYRLETRHGLESALAAASDTPATVRAKAIHVLVMVTGILGDFPTAIARAEQGLAAARELGDPLSVGRAHYDLGLAHEYAGNIREAAAAYGEAVPLLRQAGLAAWAALSLGNHAYLRLFLDGDVVSIVPLLDESIMILRKEGYASGVTLVLGQRAYAALDAGDLALAARLFTECVLAARSIDFQRAELGAIAGLAGVAAAQGELRRAARLLGAVEAIHEASASSRRIAHAPHAARITADVRDRLGEPAFTTAQTAGRDMSRDAAQADALQLAASVDSPRANRGTEASLGLTARELDVLRLIVEGCTDREIADTLFIGTRTVETHVSNLIAKLGARNRAEAAAIATRDGLTSP